MDTLYVPYVLTSAALSVGKLLGYWNIAYLSFSSIDPQLADKKTHNTLIRMMSPFNHMASALGQICAKFSVSLTLSISLCLSAVSVCLCAYLCVCFSLSVFLVISPFIQVLVGYKNKTRKPCYRRENRAMPL